MKNTKSFDVVSLGEILIDFTFHGYNEDGQKLFAQNAGGAPANVLVAVQRLGGKTAFIGKVGNDMHGKFLLDILNAENINTDGTIVDDRYFTTLAFVSINENGERSFSFARKPGADTKLSKSEIKTEILNNAKIFHVGSLSLTNEPSREATFFAVKNAKEQGCTISYDPNYRAALWKSKNIAKKHMRSLIPYVDVMKISDEETELLTGFCDEKKAAKALFDKGVKVVAVTLGKKGAYVYCKNGGAYVEAKPCKVVDTTGAGDSFWGGFLHKISKSEKDIENLTLDELATFAEFSNTVASLCVGKKGAIPAIPHLNEVERVCKNL